MTYWNLAHEDTLFKTAYEQYRQFFANGEIEPKFAPYGSLREGVTTPLNLIVYYSLLAEHSTGIANEINNLYYRIAQLSAWQKVLESYQEEEMLIILLEFVDPIASLAINLPYIIQQRLAFSLSHLSHQANLIIDSSWTESKLGEDKDINPKTMKNTTKRWQGYEEFLLFFEQLNDKDFSSITRNYRNCNQHRFPPRIEMGHTDFVTRNPKDSDNMYTVTSKYPLKITDLQSQLLRQFDIAMECYKQYDKIICNQLTKLHCS